MKSDPLDGTMGVGVPNDSFGDDSGPRTFAEADAMRAAAASPPVQPKPSAADLPESSYPGMMSGRSFDTEHDAAVYAAGAEAERARAQRTTPREDAPMLTHKDPSLPPPPKKLVHRRPLWVFIQLPPDGDSAPLYSAYRCAGVEEVRKHLADHKVDAADIDKRAIIFRADPVEVKIKTQLLIKF